MNPKIAICSLTCLLAVPSLAFADLVRTGDWPKEEKKISLDFSGPREQAVQEVAKAAGWSVVTGDHFVGDVTLHLSNIPADQVIDAVFSTSNAPVTATRKGDMVVIRAGAPSQSESAAPKEEPKKEVLPEPSVEEKGSDRHIRGQSLRIEKDEVVHDVSVMGGSVTVLGKITGDLAVTGGSATIEPGAYVKGDAIVIGGSLTVKENARLDGDVGVVGGSITKAPGSIFKGNVSRKGSGHAGISFTGSDKNGTSRTIWERTTGALGDAFAAFAMLFVFGAVLLALAPARMDQLRTEVAARPMRSFALGIVGTFGFCAALVVACVTIVGIPVALVAAILGVFAMFAGIVAVLSTVGEALIRHKNTNPYAHLALGAAIFAVLNLIPWVGEFLPLVVGLIGIGTLVTTRVAGLMVKRGRASAIPSDGPYRTA